MAKKIEGPGPQQEVRVEGSCQIGATHIYERQQWNRHRNTEDQNGRRQIQPATCDHKPSKQMGNEQSTRRYEDVANQVFIQLAFEKPGG